MLNKINWNDVEYIKQVLSECSSFREFLLRHNMYPDNSHAKAKLNKIIKDHNITFNLNRTSKKWEIVPNIIHECDSVSDVLRKIGLQNVGNNYKTANKVIKEHNLDISHFGTLKTTVKNRKFKDDEIFIYSAKISKGVLRKRLLENKLIPYVCRVCDNNGEWRRKPLTLQIEHKNGCNVDNRLNNLEFLCPNCHSQTDTYGGKNIKRKKK